MVTTDIRRVCSPILTSKRLVLRPFVIDDAASLFSWASDDDVTRYLRFQSHDTLQESQRVIKRWIHDAQHPPFFHWALERREDCRVIGSMGIEIISAHDNRGEIGYCLSKSVWNQGFATEALRTVISYAFDAGGFHRLEACHSVQNAASGRVMEKAGMVREAGPLRQYYRSDQLGYQDVYLYAAIADEWS